MFFFFNDTATTEIYTLSLHDALPISVERLVGSVRLGRRPLGRARGPALRGLEGCREGRGRADPLRDQRRHPRHHRLDRKSTRLNSSHANISYAVFCLKKKSRSPHLSG